MYLNEKQLIVSIPLSEQHPIVTRLQLLLIKCCSGQVFYTPNTNIAKQTHTPTQELSQERKGFKDVPKAFLEKFLGILSPLLLKVWMYIKYGAENRQDHPSGNRMQNIEYSGGRYTPYPTHPLLKTISQLLPHLQTSLPFTNWLPRICPFQVILGNRARSVHWLSNLCSSFPESV